MAHSKLTQHLVFSYMHPSSYYNPISPQRKTPSGFSQWELTGGGAATKTSVLSAPTPKPPHLSIKTDLYWVQVLATRKVWESVCFSRQS